MLLRLHAVWLVPLALTLLLDFGLSNAKAIAQTTYPFEANFTSETTLTPIGSNISRVTDIAQTTDAPYGITGFINTNYSQFDPATNTITFGPDAAQFGLEGLPIGTVTFSGSDRLFGTISGTASLDFANLVGNSSGTINITGGEGRFSGAVGSLTFNENDTVNPDPTAPLRGQALVSGSFQTPAVPEPKNDAALISLGVLGTGFLLRRLNLGNVD